MTTRALVTYASKHGSTHEIAEVVADAMRDEGLEVDCREAGEVRSLDRYDAVVLGSAVYMKRWRHEAKAFLRRHQESLASVPFWVFSSGPCGKGAMDENGAMDLSWSEPPGVIEQIEHMGVREHVVFGGRVPLEAGFIGRAMARETPEELADLRDWDEIRAWATGIAEVLDAGALAAR